MLFGAPAFAGAVAPFPRGAERGHAARRRRRFRGRASRGGLAYCLQVGVRARVSLLGVSFAVSESQRPDDLVCCVQRRRSGACVLRGAAGSAIVVSPCLRAGGRVRMSRGWCAGALARCSLWGWRKGVPGGGCLPPLRGASGVRRCPSPGRPSSGAGSRGSATRVSRVRSVRARGPSTGPTACTLAGRRCSLWEWRKGVPVGGAFHHCVRGVCGQALSLPRLPAHWAGRWGPLPTCCGRGCVGVGA